MTLAIHFMKIEIEIEIEKRQKYALIQKSISKNERTDIVS